MNEGIVQNYPSPEETAKWDRDSAVRLAVEVFKVTGNINTKDPAAKVIEIADKFLYYIRGDKPTVLELVPNEERGFMEHWEPIDEEGETWGGTILEPADAHWGAEIILERNETNGE